MNEQELIAFKRKALHWAKQFKVFCCLDSNNYSDPYSVYDFLLAAGIKYQLNAPVGTAFNKLKEFHTKHPDWLFGMLGYDLKNELENLNSAQHDNLEFPDLYFFVPENLIAIKNGTVKVLRGDDKLIEVISEIEPSFDEMNSIPAILPKMSKEVYLSKIEDLKNSIALGDIYEVTFCQEFFAENAIIDPYITYNNLNSISPTPFSGFFKIDEQFVLSASPERFLCKRGNRLISQPIKGTARRNIDPVKDLRNKSELANSAKEKAENVMIVDLVRNDLSKNAVKGSVKVTELFGIYTFPQVHQMISTISCEINPGISPVDAISATFPAGSMTGAPKLRAMELIEEKECSKRGMYSGAMGYFNPSGDFDFNVVIRSILYNRTSKYLSFQVGGAITFNSSADAEYEECLVKASAIVQTLKGQFPDPF